MWLGKELQESTRAKETKERTHTRVKEHTQQQGWARAKERKEQSQLQARTSMTALEANTDGASTPGHRRDKEHGGARVHRDWNGYTIQQTMQLQVPVPQCGSQGGLGKHW